MPTRPSQGGSSGTWGTELNAWLDVSHDSTGRIHRDDVGTTFGDTGSFVNLRRSITAAQSTYQVVSETYVQGHGARSTGSFYYGWFTQMADDNTVASTVPTISGAANNGSGLIRITCTGHGFTTGDWIAVYGVGGTTEANGAWALTVIDANTFDLQGSTFTHAYTSGGKATNRPGMYGGFVTVIPRQSRDLLLTGTASDVDDLNGYGVYNGSSNNSKALTAYLVNANAGFTGDMWWSGFQIEANVTYGFVIRGNVSQYGLDFCGGASVSTNTYGTGAVRLPNNVPVMGRNAANSADVEVIRLDNTNAVKFNTTVTFASSVNANQNVSFNSSMTIGDAVNVTLNSTTGTKFGTATTQKMGFFNATPVVQPNTTGTTAGFTASTGTTVVSGSTFTGNTGSTAYTIGDIVNALKKLGLMAA